MSDGKFFHIIQAVSAANDIVEVVSEHLALKRSGKGFVGLCPFHREKTPSFNVSPDRQIFKCFGCGVGGDVIKFVQNMLGLTFREALDVLAQRGGVKIDLGGVKRGKAEGPGKTDLYRVNGWAVKVYSRCLWDRPEGEQARNYLSGRQLSEDICRQFSIGFAPGGRRTLVEAAGRSGVSPDLLVSAGLALQDRGTYRDIFHDRVIFPIVDAIGNVVGFGGRTLGGAEPKYLNTSETSLFQKSRCVFGLFQSRGAIQSSRQAVVVEGYTDCIACHQMGVPNVVATLGTALTEQHVLLLRRYADEIVLVFDSDEAGAKAADRALSVFLGLGVDVKVAELSGGEDPCDFVLSEGAEAFRTVISSATEALEYKWRVLRDQYARPGGTASRRRAVEELLRTIAQCDPWGKVDAIQRGMVLTRLSGLLSVPVEQLTGMLGKYRRRPVAGGADRSDVGRVGRLPQPQTAAESAFRELLAVLVCEPGYVGGLEGILSPGDFEPEVHRRIGERIWQAHSELGEFGLRELLGLVEDIDEASVITELHREGLARGNFSATVEHAVRCIQDHRREQEASKIVAEMTTETSEEAMDRHLAVLQKNLSETTRRVPGALFD